MAIWNGNDGGSRKGSVPMRDRLKSLIRPARKAPLRPPERQKLLFQHMPDVIYAIGDVHGHLDLLLKLEALIGQDAKSEAGEKVLILLGDYIDRGPASAEVIEHVMRPARQGLRTFQLAGNHEEIMLDFLANPAPDHPWLRFGGTEALRSYGIEELPRQREALEALLRDRIPETHRRFLEALPSMIAFPDLCFAHGGTDPDVELKDQLDEVLLWKRPDDQTGPQPYLLVHGHTPVQRAEVTPTRVNVDTGAYATGVLSAVKIKKSGEIFIVSCTR